MHPTTVAVDLAKSVFELAVADVHGHAVARHRFIRRQFERFLASQPARHIVKEACGTAHHWGRVAHRHGHQVTLLPAQYVRPYARGNKTDHTDAEALLEAVRSGRIVPVAVHNKAIIAVANKPARIVWAVWRYDATFAAAPALAAQTDARAVALPRRCRASDHDRRPTGRSSTGPGR